MTYADGAPQTVDQYSRDVAAFLMWAAEPKLEERKETGFKVMIFLIAFAVLLYLTKNKICATSSTEPAPASGRTRQARLSSAPGPFIGPAF